MAKPNVYFRSSNIQKRMKDCKLVAEACGWHPNNVINFLQEVNEAFSYEEAMVIIKREFNVVT